MGPESRLVFLSFLDTEGKVESKLAKLASEALRI
jgi:hypothetical protein